jgi:hypothetical protein
LWREPHHDSLVITISSIFSDHSFLFLGCILCLTRFDIPLCCLIDQTSSWFDLLQIPGWILPRAIPAAVVRCLHCSTLWFATWNKIQKNSSATSTLSFGVALMQANFYSVASSCPVPETLTKCFSLFCAFWMFQQRTDRTDSIGADLSAARRSHWCRNSSRTGWVVHHSSQGLDQHSMDVQSSTPTGINIFICNLAWFLFVFLICIKKKTSCIWDYTHIHNHIS